MDALELAKAFVELYHDAGLAGIADEMSWRQHDLANEYYDLWQAAQEFVWQQEGRNE